MTYESVPTTYYLRVTVCHSLTISQKTNWSFVFSVSRFANIASRQACMKALLPFVARKKRTPVLSSARLRLGWDASKL